MNIPTPPQPERTEFADFIELADGRTWMICSQFPDDHHAFHEDAKPGDLSLQLPSRSRSSSKKFLADLSIH